MITYPVKDAAPSIVLIDKEVYPFIKRRDCNTPLSTEIHYRTWTFKITEEYGQDEPEGIGTIRYQDVRKESVGMTAGFTLEAVYRQCGFNSG